MSVRLITIIIVPKPNKQQKRSDESVLHHGRGIKQPVFKGYCKQTWKISHPK